ncbi:Uncharacterised protein [Bacillus paranthracis]|nr:Uncharacterised protein [Bacillus paranthracis]CKF71769.1 Uncharacterised protein [Bacillus paranthracis]CKF71797.1 Uncharacterised protein [Bacillus paranthracis]CKF71826.1 Uncharacterised protein [Bacillus paranthracis]CKF71857.1 Uncharacterised protein [Bacillus paranthracis]
MGNSRLGSPIGKIRNFTEAASKVEGSGWAILVWVPRSGRLEILQKQPLKWKVQDGQFSFGFPDRED